MHPDRWEHGSDFHYMVESGEPTFPWKDARLLGSGRDALRTLLVWGQSQGWRRLFCPSYYCGDVLESVVASGIALASYPDSPLREAPSIGQIAAGAGDAILVVDYFGLRKFTSSIAAPPGAIVIEDHTHDPCSEWAFASDAEYAFASLRKTLPIPDGGVVWSPRDRPLPPSIDVTAAHAEAARVRLEAMILKQRYLDGASIEKSTFRALAIAGESAIGRGAASGMTPFSEALLATFPIRAWREARRSSFDLLLRALEDAKGVRPLLPQPGAVPYALTLSFDAHAGRDALRAALIEERIYPAILWPQDGVGFGASKDGVDLASRLLTIHCDQRYGAGDIERVARVVKRELARLR